MMGALGFALATGVGASEEVRELTPPEMAEARGGVSVTRNTVYGGFGEDNVPFSFNYTSSSTTTQYLGIFAGSTKTASLTVAAGASGTWNTRTNWPISGTHLETVKYTPDTSTWSTSYTGVNRSISTNVRMLLVRGWNTRIAGVGTAINFTQLQQVIDEFNTLYGDTTRSVDAIFTQCSTSGAQVQLRLEGVYGQIDLANCANPVVPPPAFSVDPCTEEVFNETTSNGTNLTRVNLVFVPGIDGAVAFHHRGEHYDTNREYWIALRAGDITSARFPRLLAHELTHWVWPNGGVSHVTTGCDGTVNANVMCANWGLQGRRLTTDQCTDLHQEPVPYYRDWN